MPPARPPDVAVVVCTRNRSQHVHPTLDRLLAQDPPVPVLVVDQSDVRDERLAERQRLAALTVVHDSGRGLSRARNLAWRSVQARWVVFVDDDCHVAPDWSRRLHDAVARHADAAFLSGHVEDSSGPRTDGLIVSAFPVEREEVRRGARTWPWEIGFGVCMAVRRDWIVRLDGWDERLGAGVPRFPAGEDMDFNFRLLRAGGTAVAVPEVRAVHDQWREGAELVDLFGCYATGYAGFAAKTIALGDVRHGLRLWGHGAYGATKMLLSALRRRSVLRARVAVALAAGHARGTARALRTDWRG